MFHELSAELLQIGQWSPASQNKLQISSKPQQNKQSSGLVPLDKLNRRLKVVVVKVRNVVLAMELRWLKTVYSTCGLIDRYCHPVMLILK